MSAQKLASIVFKFLGIYLFATHFTTSMVSFIPYLGLGSSQQTQLFDEYAYIFLLPILFYISLGFIFILFADSLARLIIKSDNAEQINLNITAEDFQRILFSFLGLYFIGLSIPKLVDIIINVQMANKQFNILSPNAAGNLYGLLVQLFLGIIIFFSSKGLVGLLKALRYSGNQSTNDREYD